jgi:hypothetical protein
MLLIRAHHNFKTRNLATIVTVKNICVPSVVCYGTDDIRQFNIKLKVEILRYGNIYNKIC